MVLDDLPDEPAKEWHFHALVATDVGNQELQDGLGHGTGICLEDHFSNVTLH